jgi:hypothetical protein
MIPKSDIEDQWTVISDCITKPDEAHQAIDILTTQDMFTEPGAAIVFEGFRELHKVGKPTDINHVLECLEQNPKIARKLKANPTLADEIVAKVHEAACQVRVATPVSYWAERVRESYRKRVASDILFEGRQSLQSTASLADVVEDVMEKLNIVSGGSVSSKARRRRIRPDDGFQPFPVHVLPEAMRTFIKATSRAIGCDPSFVALPMLSAAASAIGTTRKLMVKRGWFVPSILWAVIIGESGTQKSPPMRAVMKPFQALQNDALSRFRSEHAEYKQELHAYRKAAKKSPDIMQDEPTKPICTRCIVNDATVEGLVPILEENPRGVWLVRDELVGWMGSFDKYSSKGSTSADVAHWLSIYNADSLIVDRKTGDRTSMFVPSASVSVCGGIQPGILNRVLTNEHRENGLAARLLMTYPPRQPKQWRDDEIPSRVEQQWSDLIRDLFELKHDSGSDGKPMSALVKLTDDARHLVAKYVDETGDEQYGMTGDIAAAWSKLEEIPMRLALIVHCVRQVTGESVDAWLCDAASVSAGIELANWF